MKIFLSVLLILPCILNAEKLNVFKRNFEILHELPPPPPPPAMKQVSTVKTDWIEQKVNNFDSSDTRIWKMRYMSNDHFFEKGGPIFIFVGGEWEIDSGFISGGHMYDMADEMKGYLFYTEHRYYGESYPTEDITTKNLKYLSVDQSLEDLAHFIRTMKDTIPGLENSKVFLVGGSYSASMVTWFTRIYPDLVNGAWASSAPLLAKVDYVEYKEVVGESIKIVGGEECYKRIENGIKKLEDLIDKKNSSQLIPLLKLCESFDFENKLDVWSLFSSISDLFAGLVQGHTTGNIENACVTIMSPDDDVSGVISFIMSRLGGSECYDFGYKSSIDAMRETKKGGIMRQWLYQTCSEFGWYQTSGSKNQIFGKNFPVDFYIQMCHDIYDKKFTNSSIHKSVSRTNKVFGGMTPRVKNVYITHGQLDPWKMMGIRTNTDESTEIPLYAHCKDFGSISDVDTKEMKASKIRVRELARKWLK